jgi:hypothetical protein
MNISLINIDDLFNSEVQIKRMEDSVIYINNRLDTFYNTDQEKKDIARNVEYLEQMLSKKFIKDSISNEKRDLFLNAIERGKTVLS